MAAGEPADGELLRRHVNGDTDAFGVLFTRHKDRLWAVALRTLGDPEEAADALQDAMVSAFRQAAGFRGDSAVTTWMHRIVVNACLDRLRRRAARPTSGGLDEQAMDALARRTEGTDEADSTETSLVVRAALRGLPPEQRAALVLVDMLGYAVADAADVLNVSVGTVKSRCARGRARLLPRLAHLRTGELPPEPSPPPSAPLSAAAREETVTHDSPPTGNRSASGRVSPGKGGGDHTP